MNESTVPTAMPSGQPPIGVAAASASAPPSQRAEGNPGEETGPFRMAVLREFGAKYLKGHLGWVLSYIMAHLLVQTVFPQQVALYMGKLTNHFAGSEGGAERFDPTLLTSYGFWILFTLLVLAGGFGFQWLTSKLDGKVANGVKSDLFAKLLRQPPAFYHRNDSDRLTMVVNQYANQISGTLRSLLIEPALQVVAIVIIGISIFRSLQALASGPQTWTLLGINGVWVLFGAILLFALSSPWIVNRMGRYLQRDAAAVQSQHLGLATLIGGALKAPEEIQAMRAEPVFERKLAELLDRSLASMMAQTVTMGKVNTFGQLPGTVVLAGFLGLAIYLEMRGIGGQPGTIVQVALLTPLLMSAIQQLSGFGITLRMGWPPMELIDRILASAPQPERHADAAEKPMSGPLEARDLVFSYEPGKRPNVLEGATFQIPEGKVTGFVARPGQGKTTFFRLALRFYDWQSGGIFLGGESIREMSLSTVRRHLVLMSQFPAFFYDTVRENMKVAAPWATDEDIKKACDLTGLSRVLEKSIGGDALDQPFAAGAGLSGGQKKLFALTRCLLRDPSVLFLDEPTTGMGPMEKFPLIDAMRRSLAGKTVVVVDHDIVWQSRFCDYFHVLSDGKIIQSGTADELLGQPGLFRQLYDEASGASRTQTASLMPQASVPIATGRPC